MVVASKQVVLLGEIIPHVITQPRSPKSTHKLKAIYLWEIATKSETIVRTDSLRVAINQNNMSKGDQDYVYYEKWIRKQSTGVEKP